jgi:hypothetical protein
VDAFADDLAVFDEDAADHGIGLDSAAAVHGEASRSTHVRFIAVHGRQWEGVV